MVKSRAETWAQLEGEFDVLVIGGGATGLGIAVDAATRGYRTALVEAGDFGQATSSRSTKLVHGGVRYLASGQLPLVYEALRERRVMLRNAPHLVQALPFVTPAYRWRELPWYGAGLKLYDLLSGKSSLGKTKILGARKTRALIPGIAATKLKGSVLYFDGQFDDARLALALARTAGGHGAVVMNYVRCTELLKVGGKVVGVRVADVETGRSCTVRAQAVINATGIFVDELRQQDIPGGRPLLSVSRGTHVVIGPEFLQEDSRGQAYAIMVPKTRDGRIIFAIPWLGKVVIGTTDIPARAVQMEPGHDADEIDFLLETINPYLARRVTRADILSVFSGLRPLVTGKQANTAKLSREHHIDVSPSGLVTIAGGKWTTYRRMAEETLDFAIGKQLLPARPCVSKGVPLRGAPTDAAPLVAPCTDLARYGSDAAAVQQLEEEEPTEKQPLVADLPYTAAEVRYAARAEMARTVEDVLSRRMRALLLDARAAEQAATQVAYIMAEELGHDKAWAQAQIASFAELARRFYEVPRAPDETGGVLSARAAPEPVPSAAM